MIYVWFTSAVCHEQSKYIFDWPTPKIFQSLSKVDGFLNQPQKCEINNYVKINKHCKKYGINQHYNVLIEKHCKNVELVNALIDQHCKKCWWVEKFIYAECDCSAKWICCCVIWVLSIVAFYIHMAGNLLMTVAFQIWAYRWHFYGRLTYSCWFYVSRFIKTFKCF